MSIPNAITARIDVPVGLDYHPRDLELSLSKPIQEKLINELRRANEHIFDEKPPLRLTNQPFHLLAQTPFQAGDTFYVSVDGENIGAATAQGLRPTMEDALTYRWGNIGGYDYDLFVLIDGHGGSFVAEFVACHLKDEIEKAFLKQDSLTDENGRNALKEAFVQLDARLKMQEIEPSGAVVIVCLKIGSDLWTANLGDCRAILKVGDEIIQLSVDAKPEKPCFKKSIEKRGGEVMECFSEGEDFYRIKKLGLAPARAFRSDHFKGREGYYVVSPRPKITKINLEAFRDLPIHLIQACDGIWDVATSKDVASIIDEKRTPHELARAIVEGALAAGSDDNCSALVARLNPC